MDYQFEEQIECELCGRICDVRDEQLATEAGWEHCWDGWICPGHAEVEP